MMTKCELKSRLRRVAERYAASNAGHGLHIDHSDPAFRRSGIPHAEFARRATLAARHADQQFQDVNLPRAYVYGAFLKYRDIYDHRLTPNEFKHLLAEVHKGGHIDLSRAIATDRVNPAILYDSQVNIGPRDLHREFHFIGHPRSHPVWVFRPDSRETFAKCPEYQECVRDYAERYAADPCGDASGGFQEGNTCAGEGKAKLSKPKIKSEKSVVTDKEINKVLDEFHAHNRKDKVKFATDIIRERRKDAISSQKRKEAEFQKQKEKSAPSEPEKKPETPKEVKPETPQKVDKEAIARNVESARKVAKQYGLEVVDSLEPIRDKADVGDKNTFAAYHLGSNKIYINTDNPKWSNIKETLDDNYKKGWFSSNHDDFVIHHEIGHALHTKNIRADVVNKKSFLDKILNNIESFVSGMNVYEFEGDIKTLQMFNKELPDNEAKLIAKEVSQYAATKPTEFVAEYFAGVKGGKTYSKEIQDLYAKYLGPEVK